LDNNIGMLWFYNIEKESKNKKTLREVILEAIAYYEEKYGKKVTEVHIPEKSIFSPRKDAIDGILVKRDVYVLPNHLMVY
jgi:hypothetical protein